jgi:hypothetical protein
MHESQHSVPLTAEERTLLERTHALHGKANRFLGVFLTIGFHFLWMFMAWASLADGMGPGWTVVAFLTFLLAVTATYDVFYKKKKPTPWQLDLGENRKIQETGQIISLYSRKYTTYVVFRSRENHITKEFSIPNKTHYLEINHQIRQAYDTKKEIEIEYTPHAQLVLRAGLVVPLTPEEEKEQQITNRIAAVIFSVLFSAFVLYIGWLFDILFFVLPLYLGVVLLIGVLIWREKRSQKT